MGGGKDLTQLKNDLGMALLDETQVRSRQGLATGIRAFDEALLWKGFPQGELSLLSGERGLGLASLCVRAIEKTQETGRWGAWINSEWSFFPTVSMTKLQCGKLLVVEKPPEPKKLFWLLQEMISSTLFEIIVCHLPELSFRPSDLARLKSLARGSQVALIFLTESPPRLSSLFALILEIREGDRLILRRALHRQTPRTLEGVLSHARAVPALSGRGQPLLG